MWRYIYFGWLVLGFVLSFLLLYPIFWIIMLRKSWHKYYHLVSRLWAWMWYAWAFLHVRTYWEARLEHAKTYIFCANHFSFFDIPLLTLTIPRYFAFVGLHDLLGVPLFGKLFRTLHIPIDRSNARDKYRTYQDSKRALQEGKCIVIFPEGGIWADASPTLMPFKEGVFRMAIEMQVPIVPITIPYNWHILSLFKIHKLQWRTSKVIFHAPIETTGLTRADVGKLKEQVFEIIDQTLKKHLEVGKT